MVVQDRGIRHAFALDELAEEPTVRGQFVRDVLAAPLADDERQRVLSMGLRALDPAGTDSMAENRSGHCAGGGPFQ